MPTNPPRWDDAQLDRDRLQAIANFIEARQSQLAPRYRRILRENLRSAITLFRATNNLLDLHTGLALAHDPALTGIARYTAGPPVSQDDLDTLAGTSIAKRRTLDITRAATAAEVIGDALDRYRFPWLFAEPRRAPTRIERKVALGWTAGLKTAQEVATEVRTESSEEQERKVIGVLEAAGYAARSGGPIHFMDDLERGTFRHDETLVGGVKCDVPARLHDGRLLLIDCKVSNSGTNSVKRLNRECGGKASG